MGKALLLFIFSFFLTLNIYSQDSLEKLSNLIDSQTQLPVETAYLHLNKTSYIVGEQIGFKAYVLDRKSLKPSRNTTNLYVQIKDEQSNVIKEKMVFLKIRFK